jgi:hypothetical protein
MGTDITVRFERKTKENKWVEANVYDKEGTLLGIGIDRNYKLFALLANVRNRFNIEPLSENRGVPNDICEETYNAFFDKDIWMDFSDHSYFTLQELYRHLEATKDKELNNVLSKFVCIVEATAESYEFYRSRSQDFRVIFAFDN